MGRKVNPVGFRLGIVTDWESTWFAERNYTEQLHEDLAIRKFIFEQMPRAGISRVELERSANKVDVTLFTSKPGIVIGKQGSNVERMKASLETEFGKKINLKIEEIKVPETDAQLIAESIAEQIARRVSYRRAMKHSVQQAMRRGAKGVKIRLVRPLGWRGNESVGYRDGWPGAAAHAACGYRFRRRSRSHHVWPDRRQGLGVQRRCSARAESIRCRIGRRLAGRANWRISESRGKYCHVNAEAHQISQAISAS